MYDILMMVTFIVVLLTILGCLPYAIWVIYSLFKKRWKRVGLQIVIPLAIYAVLFSADAFFSAREHADDLNGLFDAQVTLGPTIFNYESVRSFLGDGYSISVYELPSAIRQRFESPDQKLLTEYPKHPGYRDHWKFEHWREAPFDDVFKEYLDFALSTSGPENREGLELQFEAIRKALARKGTYYAFFYNVPSGYVGDVDFFIVDLVEGRLYMINLNT